MHVTYMTQHNIPNASYMKRSEVPHQQQRPTRVLAFDFRPAAIITGEQPSSNRI